MQKSRNSLRFTTKVIVYGALFAALAAVLGQLLAIRPTESMKFTLDKFVLFLSGMFFGPLVGGMTGFVAEFAGGNLFGRGFTLWLSIPAIAYGVFGGLFRHMLAKKFTVPRLVLAYLCPTALAAVLIQSAALAFTYNAATFWETFYLNLMSRSVQFSIMLVVEVTIIYLLIVSGIFNRVNLWPPIRKTSMTADEAIAYIESVSWKGSVPGLERPQELLRRMGNPEKQLKYVHIGGTNGKGSTAAMTASILQAAGYTTGLYTSPHIHRFHERIRVNGQDISDEALAEITEYVKPLAQSMEDVPTEFELVWCIAAEYFKRMGCDIVVTEVGMGGQLDATNVIPAPEVAVLTNIGLDHTDFLGDTLEKIAQTKAGIIKEGCHAVVYPSTPSVQSLLTDICAQRNVPLQIVDFGTLKSISHDLTGQVFDCGDRKALELPLLGEHQMYNASVALGIVDALIEKGWSITENHIREGLKNTLWPGRFDVASHDPLFIIDGGHNPQCLEALVKNMQDYLSGRRIIGLTGVLADKDYGQMYLPVLPLVEQFVCITPPNDRKLEAAELAAHLTAVGAKAVACDSIPEGVKTAQQLAGKDGVVLCFGSLYSIGQIKKAL